MWTINRLKVIAGIANVDLDRVTAIARAAEEAGAEALDVAARKDIVATARSVFSGILFASSVEPAALADAVEAGADVAELGNFDALYETGVFLDQNDVLALARETVALVAGRAKVSITVPGHLAADTQVQLVKKLEALGVDLIQTEGSARLLSGKKEVKLLGAAEKFALTLTNTRTLVAATRLPVMTASGITPENVRQAFEAGAAAVGVGGAIRQETDVAGMTRVIRAVMASIPECATAAVS